jgi:hypothetical protein
LERQGVRKIKDKVKKPALAFADKFGFLQRSKVEKASVVCADFQENTDSSAQSKQRENILFQGVRSLVKVHRASVLEEDLLGAFQSFQAEGRFCNYIATHLRTQLRQRLSQAAIAKMVQPDAVPLFFQHSNLCNLIASLCEQILQLAKSFILVRSRGKLDGNGSFHRKDFMLQTPFNSRFRERHFLSALKDRVSLPSIG